MATATSYVPLLIDHLDREWEEEVHFADGPAMAACGFTSEQFSDLPDGHPGVIAWERVVDEALAEVDTQIRDLLYNALQKRLPWTWESER